MVDKITRWLHLSDLHLLLDKDDTTMQKLRDDYNSFFINYRKTHKIDVNAPLFDFVVITGDLHDSSGNSSNNNNYQLSIKFLNNFIGDDLKVEKENVFIVPGNHDAEYPIKKNEKTGATVYEKVKDKKTGKYILKVDSKGRKIPARDSDRRASFDKYASFIMRYFCEDCKDINCCKKNECDKNKYIKWVNDGFKDKYVIKWSEKFDNDIGSSISVLHLNTASWYSTNKPKDDSNGCGGIKIDQGDGADNQINVFKIEEGAPVIAISHNPYRHFNDESQTWMKDQVDKNNISVHLCGDVHRRETIPIGETGAYSICCSKISSDKRDEGWSDFGFIIYEWNHNAIDYDNPEKKYDGKVTVYPYSWNVFVNRNEDGTIIEEPKPAKCGIQPAHDFRKKNDDEEFFFWLKQHGELQGSDYKAELYIGGDGVGKQYESNIDHHKNFYKILNILEKNENKPNVLVIGDVMLDLIEICKLTSVGQSQSHDVKDDFTTITPDQNNDDTKNEANANTALPDSTENNGTNIKEKQSDIEEYILESKHKNYSLNIRENEIIQMGGAANVAAGFNKVSKNVKLFGVIGNDSTDIFGQTLSDLTTKKLGKENNHLFPMAGYMTVTKMYLKEYDKAKKITSTHTRINRELDGNEGYKMLMNHINLESRKKFLHDLKLCLPEVDVIVLKDHEKGLLNTPNGEHKTEGIDEDFPTLIIKAINEEYINRQNKKKKLFIILDPKYKWDCFKNLVHIDAILPNVKEMAAMLYPDNNKIWADREAVCKIYAPDRKKLFSVKNWWNKDEKVDCIAITEGKNGVSFYRPGTIVKKDRKRTFEHSIPGIPIGRDYKSEIGCGDIFDAYFTTCIFNKAKIKAECNFDDTKFYEYALKLANYAAGMSCTRETSRTYSIEDIRKDLFDEEE